MQRRSGVMEHLDRRGDGCEGDKVKLKLIFQFFFCLNTW